MKKSAALLTILLAGVASRSYAADSAAILARAKEAAGGTAWDAPRSTRSRRSTPPGSRR